MRAWVALQFVIGRVWGGRSIESDFAPRPTLLRWKCLVSDVYAFACGFIFQQKFTVASQESITVFEFIISAVGRDYSFLSIWLQFDVHVSFFVLHGPQINMPNFTPVVVVKCIDAG